MKAQIQFLFIALALSGLANVASAVIQVVPPTIVITSFEPQYGYINTRNAVKGDFYIIQSSTNLINWTDVQTNSAGNPNPEFDLISNQPPPVFYRIENLSALAQQGNPRCALILSGDTLYGTAQYGGSSGDGMVFAVNTNGTGFTILHSFTAISTDFVGGTNSDGAVPVAPLILSGNGLYGTAEYGGTYGDGTIFAVNTDGTDFTNLHSFSANSIDSAGVFTNSDGVNPSGGLVLSGNTLYGTAEDGGTNGSGTVFAVNTLGTDFTNLYSFSAKAVDSATGYETNSDGAYPSAGLILSGNTLYGTAEDGGTNGSGTVFTVNTLGTDFTILHSFTAISTDIVGGTNSDGAVPVAPLILSGNALYGTVEYGGTYGDGTIFAVNTDGTDFTNLHSFAAKAVDSAGVYTNSDGVNPSGGLVLSGNTLYGTAAGGGTNGKGTIFAVNTDGTDFTNLCNFTPSSDGANPQGQLILSGNTLNGTAISGGSTGSGTVYSVSTNGGDFMVLHNFGL